MPTSSSANAVNPSRVSIGEPDSFTRTATSTTSGNNNTMSYHHAPYGATTSEPATSNDRVLAPRTPGGMRFPMFMSTTTPTASGTNATRPGRPGSASRSITPITG